MKLNLYSQVNTYLSNYW